MRRPFRIETRPPLRSSGDRWLFGYADVVTLLFACFASLYAAQVAPGAVQRALADVPLPVEVTGPLAAETVVLAEPDRWAATLADIAGIPGLVWETTPRGLVISLPEAGSFAPGRAELTPAASSGLRRLGAALADVQNAIRVEGHTDTAPIRTSLYASNWELSTARATRVVQFLIEQAGLPPSRLAAAGYAEYRPRVPNDTPARRARNRRVDIVLLDAGAGRAEVPSEGVR